MISPAQASQYMDAAWGISLPPFLISAACAKVETAEPAMIDAGYSESDQVLIPVNLRNLFPSRSLRNFASYITPEIDPRMGDCSFSELCSLVHHKMGLENNRRTMRAKFAANVASERSPILRVMPLFIKNIAMKAVFDAVGECKSCLCLSNLGRVELPEVMVPYIARMDFIIGVQAKAREGFPYGSVFQGAGGQGQAVSLRGNGSHQFRGAEGAFYAFHLVLLEKEARIGARAQAPRCFAGRGAGGMGQGRGLFWKAGVQGQG